MKYIRTKEHGVCKVTNEDNITLSYESSYICGCLCKDNWKDKIQYADTIEELCDEFVSIYKNLTPELLEPKFVTPREPLSVSWKNRLEEERLFKDTVVYGAIWTDKGLIYVAKMNENGELELL